MFETAAPLREQTSNSTCLLWRALKTAAEHSRPEPVLTTTTFACVRMADRITSSPNAPTPRSTAPAPSSSSARTCARMVDPILSPSAAMAEAGGPRKRMPVGVSSSASGSSGFSLAWPLQDGCATARVRGLSSCSKHAGTFCHAQRTASSAMHYWAESSKCSCCLRLVPRCLLRRSAHQPGHTASTPVRMAVATISCTLA